MRRLLWAGVAIVALSCGGCGTISDMTTGLNGQRIFGGVRKDSSLITHPDSSPVEVSVTLGMLQITGQRQVRAREDREQFQLKYVEHPFGRFRRTIPLPLGAQTEGLEARLRDGVLEVRIPRDPGVTDAKTIHIA